MPVPLVPSERRDCLIFSDMGPTLGKRLRQLESANHADILVERTMAAIGDVHRSGGYLGQAFPRNITIDGKQLGFIDFEEDPSEIMPLEQAQARDWVMFTAGVAPHYVGRADRLAALLHDASAAYGQAEVEASVRQDRRAAGLRRAQLPRPGAAGEGAGLDGLRLAQEFRRAGRDRWLLADYFSDGDLDTWRVLVEALA